MEGLESRALMATGVFTAPDLTPYIHAALYQGVNTAPAVIRVMDKALQQQLTDGPLAGLKDGSVTPADFQTEVSNLVASFRADAATQLSPRFPNVTKIIQDQGTKIESQLAAIGAQQDAGFITDATQITDSTTAINALTGGPLFPLHTPLAGYQKTTQTLLDNLKTISGGLATGANPALTLTQAQTLATADTKAYQNSVDASLFLRPNVAAKVATAVTTFDTTVNAITEGGTTSTQDQFNTAIAALDAALLDTTGLFGPSGPVAWHLGTAKKS